ncbi:MAG: 2-amino-4-hydroxy-6-hydroxymethyldihydropteridine diphosphokinase [Gammaproteobacteria bacterium]
MTRVFIGVGSNVDRERNVPKGVRALRAAFREIRCSTVWDNPAVGFDGDPFLNLVVEVETPRSASDVAAQLDRIERGFGRARSGDRKLLARALDLDLLLYGDAVIDQEAVRVPRGEILDYAFVLAPLAELAPEAVHPTVGRSYKELWSAFEGDKTVLKKAELALD